jgi:hypothetical protein
VYKQNFPLSPAVDTETYGLVIGHNVEVVAVEVLGAIERDPSMAADGNVNRLSGDALVRLQNVPYLHLGMSRVGLLLTRHSPDAPIAPIFVPPFRPRDAHTVARTTHNCYEYGMNSKTRNLLPSSRDFGQGPTDPSTGGRVNDGERMIHLACTIANSLERQIGREGSVPLSADAVGKARLS